MKIFKAHLNSLTSAVVVPRKAHRPSCVEDWSMENPGFNLDDNVFRNLVNESEVLGLKDYTKWNWDSILELSKGSFLNPKRFDELVRNTKFAARLVTFLKPSSKQFCDTIRDENSYKIISSCSNFICTMLSSSSGQRFLMETKLLSDIIDRLARLGDPSIFEMDAGFSKDGIDGLLAKDYFTFLGDIQKLPEGERLFENNGVWSLYYSLIELRGKDHIVKCILNAGNYAMYAII